jgi:sphingomyelin synthase-related protein 1
MNKTQIVKNINDFFQAIPLWVYIIPFIFQTLSNGFLYTMQDRKSNYKPLYDVIISNVPDLSKYNFIPNTLMFILSSFLIIPLYIKPNYNVFISLFKYLSVIIFLRSITTSVTILPSIVNGCKFKMDLITFLNGHCIDKIFSGHTSASLLLVFLYNKYNIITSNLIYVLLFIQILLALSLILTKEHYTIDVILGYLITTMILLLLDL